MVNNVKKVFYCLSWIIWLVFCYFSAQILVSVVLQLVSFDVQNSGTLATSIISASVYVVTLAMFALGPWIIRDRITLPNKVAELVGLSRKVNWGDLKNAIGTFVIYLVVLLGVMSIFTFLFPELSAEEQNLGFDKINNSSWQLILIFISLVVVPPIFEEVIMRGVLFGRLRAKISFWPTAIIVSTIFAIAHGQINVAVDTFVLSMFLCNLREKTGTIWAPIIVHALKNLLGFILVFIVVI